MIVKKESWGEYFKGLQITKVAEMKYKIAREEWRQDLQAVRNVKDTHT